MQKQKGVHTVSMHFGRLKMNLSQIALVWATCAFPIAFSKSFRAEKSKIDLILCQTTLMIYTTPKSRLLGGTQTGYTTRVEGTVSFFSPISRYTSLTAICRLQRFPLPPPLTGEAQPETFRMLSKGCDNELWSCLLSAASDGTSQATLKSRSTLKTWLLKGFAFSDWNV